MSQQAESINVEDLCSAETVIIKAVQTQRFAKQIERLKTSKNQNNRIRQLRKNDPLVQTRSFHRWQWPSESWRKTR